MKISIKTINIVLAIPFIILLITLITESGYNGTIGIAPVYFKDIFVTIAVISGPAGVGYAILNQEQKSMLPFTLLVISFFAFYISYIEYPTVKRQNLLKKVSKIETLMEDSSEDFRNATYNSNEHRLHSIHRRKEGIMILEMYSDQLDFYRRADKIDAPGLYKMTYFFGLFGVIFLVNAVYFFKTVKKETN